MPRLESSTIRSSGRSSGLSFWPHYVAAGALIGVAILLEIGNSAGRLALWLGIFGAAVLLRPLAVLCFGTRWWLTRDQVVQSAGVISRHTTELDLQDLHKVEVRQGPIARLLNVGSVHVSCEVDTERELVLSGVRDPDRVASSIRSETDEAPSGERD